MNKIFESVLKRNHFSLQSTDTKVRIEKIGKQTSPVQVYYIYSIILCVLGLFSFFKFSALIGLVLLISGIPAYVKGKSLNKREAEESNDYLEIIEGKIIAKKSNTITELNIEEIKELSHRAEKDDDVSIGTIYAVMEDGEVYNLFEMYGFNKRFVEDDIKIIADEIAEILNG